MQSGLILVKDKTSETVMARIDYIVSCVNPIVNVGNVLIVLSARRCTLSWLHLGLCKGGFVFFAKINRFVMNISFHM